MTYTLGSVQYLDSAMWMKQHKSPWRQRRNMVSHCCTGPHEAAENKVQGFLRALVAHSSGSLSLLRTVTLLPAALFCCIFLVSGFY